MAMSNKQETLDAEYLAKRGTLDAEYLAKRQALDVEYLAKRKALESIGYGKLAPESIRLSEDKNKTLAMKLIESQLGQPMEVLLLRGKVATIAKRLGVSVSCVSRWRLRLGLRL